MSDGKTALSARLFSHCDFADECRAESADCEYPTVFVDLTVSHNSDKFDNFDRFISRIRFAGVRNRNER